MIQNREKEKIPALKQVDESLPKEPAPITEQPISAETGPRPEEPAKEPTEQLEKKAPEVPADVLNKKSKDLAQTLEKKDPDECVDILSELAKEGKLDVAIETVRLLSPDAIDKLHGKITGPLYDKLVTENILLQK